MPTLTASRRAVVATALGLAMSLSLVGCSQLGVGASPEIVGCSLSQWHGYLTADNDRVFFAETQGARPGSGTPIDWPDGWTVRPTDDGQLEVVGDWGIVLARTGDGVVLSAVGDPDRPGNSWVRDGELVLCPYGGLSTR